MKIFRPRKNATDGRRAAVPKWEPMKEKIMVQGVHLPREQKRPRELLPRNIPPGRKMMMMIGMISGGTPTADTGNGHLRPVPEATGTLRARRLETAGLPRMLQKPPRPRRNGSFRSL